MFCASQFLQVNFCSHNNKRIFMDLFNVIDILEKPHKKCVRKHPGSNNVTCSFPLCSPQIPFPGIPVGTIGYFVSFSVGTQGASTGQRTSGYAWENPCFNLETQLDHLNLKKKNSNEDGFFFEMNTKFHIAYLKTLEIGVNSINFAVQKEAEIIFSAT